MAEILFDLEQVLRSKQHKLTIEETNMLMNCKSKGLKAYCVGAISGGGISWIATSRLKFFGRLSISAGVSAVVGLWSLGRSLDSCVDRILALEGTKIQKELANLVVTKYGNDQWRMQRISKHFYSEEVFGDSNVDKPELRWRYRNFFSDDVGSAQRATEGSSDGESQGESHGDSHGEEHKIDAESEFGDTGTDERVASDGRKLNSNSKKSPLNPTVDELDPLDCVFGNQVMEEIHHPKNNPSTAMPSRTNSRKERRAQRRRRMMRHNQNALANPQPV